MRDFRMMKTRHLREKTAKVGRTQGRKFGKHIRSMEVKRVRQEQDARAEIEAIRRNDNSGQAYDGHSF